MENLECPQCGNALAKGVEVCGACGAEMKPETVENVQKVEETDLPPAEKRPGRKTYAVLALLLVLLGGAAVLIFTGLLPNPIKGGGGVAAIVNGEKITIADLDQKFELYQKMSGKSGAADLTTPAGKAAAADLRMQILNSMIQDKVLASEAVREKIAVTEQEVAERIAIVKKNLNMSDQDFEAFLKNHGMTKGSFEKRIEKDLLISRLVDKGTKEKGMTQEAWLSEINNRAKVDILIK